MIRLRRQHLHEDDWSDVARQLDVFFQEEVITPVLKIIRPATAQSVVNAAGDDALRRALKTGKVQYAHGVFSGDLNAAISIALKRLGARFDQQAGVFRLDPWLLPQWIMAEASAYFARAHGANEAIRRELDAALDRIDQGRYDVDSARMVAKVDEGWRASASRLALKPPLTREGQENLAAFYSENLDLYIKKWLKKDILVLRQDVQKNAETGYRFDKLIDIVQRRGAVGRSKAKFLARQETGMFMSGYRAQRFIAAGVFTYQWSNSHDSRVRPEAGLSPRALLHAGNHRVLNGMVFDYRTKAPAQYMSSRKPCNPGEDYLCRCQDIPLATPENVKS